MSASRRGFFGLLFGGVAVAALPASVLSVPQSAAAPLVTAARGKNTLLTIDMITMEAVALFKSSNASMANIDSEYDTAFRVRVPN